LLPEREALAKAARRSLGEGGLRKMRYVYLLQSIPFPGQHYVGITSQLQDRLRKHNAGESPHTTKYRPWKVTAAIRFEDDGKAAAFERYLKTGSGRAFALKHFC
jgi:predicted GIY-YIG superfamily endonuclease